MIILTFGCNIDIITTVIILRRFKMNRKFKKFSLSVGAALTVMSMVLVTYGSKGSYTNWTSYEISFVDDATTSSNVSRRYTDNEKFGVKVKDCTMWSSPKAKVVNSEGASRSSATKLKGNTTSYGKNNTCAIGYNYKLKISSAWNQVGTDTIKYKFSVR